MKPTESAWSTLSVDCCPPPNVHVPNAMLGIVAPVHTQHSAQLQTVCIRIAVSSSPLLSFITSQGMFRVRLRKREGGGRAQAATAKTAWRGKGRSRAEDGRVSALNIAEPCRYELTYRHTGARRRAAVPTRNTITWYVPYNSTLHFRAKPDARVYRHNMDAKIIMHAIRHSDKAISPQTRGYRQPMTSMADDSTYTLLASTGKGRMPSLPSDSRDGCSRGDLPECRRGYGGGLREAWLDSGLQLRCT